MMQAGHSISDYDNGLLVICGNSTVVIGDPGAGLVIICGF